MDFIAQTSLESMGSLMNSIWYGSYSFCSAGAKYFITLAGTPPTTA